MRSPRPPPWITSRPPSPTATTIEHELGAGGLATVYLAEDPKHKRKVAVKVLRPDLRNALQRLGATEVHIVLKWFAELEERTGSD